MKVIGIDLAGSPKNNTGICLLNIEGEHRRISTRILQTDQEIIDYLTINKPDLIAVDAPLKYEGRNRRCDSELSGYGALPVTLRGMEMLAIRGTSLAKKIREKKQDVIEVYATGTAKILGLYDKNEKTMQKNLLTSGLKGELEKRFLSKDEIDAVFAALTGFLHLKNATEEVGDEDGTITIPLIKTGTDLNQ